MNEIISTFHYSVCYKWLPPENLPLFLIGSPAYTITWHPSSSSASRARFVTARAIDPKLCTYVPLGKSITHRPNFSPVWFLVWPPGGQNKKCYDSWPNGWIISKLLCPDHKMSGALCHGLCVSGVGVRKHLVSVNYRTNAWVDWSDFSVAYWGWLEEGSFRWSAPPLNQDGRYGRHLGFGFRRLQDKRLGRFIQFFCGSVGVTRRRLLSMISSATHPRWPVRPPFGFGLYCFSSKMAAIWFPSIRRQTPGSTSPIFWWLIGGDWRTFPFDDHLRHSSKMAAPPAIWIWSLLFFWPTPGSTSDFLVAHLG
jgi:hypothetical protein